MSKEQKKIELVKLSNMLQTVLLFGNVEDIADIKDVDELKNALQKQMPEIESRIKKGDI